MTHQVTSSTAKKDGPGWRTWYTIFIIVMTMLAFNHDPLSSIFVIPINWLIYYLPAWAVVATVRHFRKK